LGRHLRVNLGTARERIGWIEDHFVRGRKAGDDLNRIAEVVANGHWHELNTVASNDTDAQAFGAE
jgi:hypothetical protein